MGSRTRLPEGAVAQQDVEHRPDPPEEAHNPPEDFLGGVEVGASGNVDQGKHEGYRMQDPGKQEFENELHRNLTLAQTLWATATTRRLCSVSSSPSQPP